MTDVPPGGHFGGRSQHRSSHALTPSPWFDSDWQYRWTVTINSRGSRRSSMATDPDPRALRTRALLVAALWELAPAGRGGTLSVTRVAKAAGVTRSAFYSHFAAVDDLALFAAERYFADAGVLDSTVRRGGVSGREATTQAIDRFVRHVLDHREVWSWLLIHAPGPIRQKTVDLFTERVRDTVELSAPRPAVNPDAAAQFVAAGMMNVLHQALLADPPARRDEVAASLLAVMPGFLAG